jgi:acyl-CoA thioesterase
VSAFCDVVSLEQRDGFLTANIPAVWTNDGSAAFGGLLGAIGVSALASVAPEGCPLRSLSIHHHGAVDPGALEADVKLLDKSRLVGSAEAHLMQSGRRCVTVTATYVRPRGRALAFAERTTPPIGTPDDFELLEYAEGVMPVFAQLFDYKVAEGALPFTSARKPGLGGWCRHNTETLASAEAVVALLDAWAPAVYPLLHAPAQARTLSWTIHMVAEPVWAPDEWLYFRSDATITREGLATTTGTLQKNDGSLLATMKQLIAVREPRKRG